MRYLKIIIFCAGDGRRLPARAFVPRPDAARIGRGTAKHRCTLLAVWHTEQEEPWGILSDLPPDQAGVSWYALRFWIELGSKALKSLGRPWQKKEWCIPRVSAGFVAHMEDVLDLYAGPYDAQRPVVCFDETSTQMLSETRPPLPVEPGKPGREDCEYRREGARNLFLACEPLAGWRARGSDGTAHYRGLRPADALAGDTAYPDVPVVRLALDNLNTHRKASLYQAFPAEEARRIAKRLEFHYTAKHGSWLNMAEIGFSVFSRSCLRQRLPDGASLCRRFEPWRWSGTKHKPASTGVLAFRTPGPNSNDCIPSKPNLTEY